VWTWAFNLTTDFNVTIALTDRVTKNIYSTKKQACSQAWPVHLFSEAK